MKRSSLVRGQGVTLRGIPGQVVDAAGYLVVVELDDGRIELVPEDLVVTAESAESGERRHAGT